MADEVRYETFGEFVGRMFVTVVGGTAVAIFLIGYFILSRRHLRGGWPFRR